MKRYLKLFVIYFPILLVSGQVLGNALYFINRNIYYNWGFYLNHFLGTNIMFAIFLIAFTFMFKFCTISRWTAGAELAFALFYMVWQKDDVYNILVQITGGGLAIILTCFHYIKKYPLCKMSLLVSFIKSFVWAKGKCNDAISDWDKKTINKLEQDRIKKSSHAAAS